MSAFDFILVLLLSVLLNTLLLVTAAKHGGLCVQVHGTFKCVAFEELPAP